MSATAKERLQAVLVVTGLLSQEKLDEAFKVQQQKKGRLADILVKLGYVPPENLFEVLSAELDIPAIHLSRYRIQSDVVAVIPKKMNELYCLIPVSRFGSTLTRCL